MQHQLEPIVAVATAPGIGGVGVVRLSGHQVQRIAAALFRRTLKPRTLVYGTLRSGPEPDAEPIDEVLAVVFPGPASFTGEDVIEFHGHGGPVVLGLIVAACQAQGARLARPGEFSERAFLNDKLDLAQAEAVADLIASGSAAAARGALRSLQGVFSTAVNELAEDLLWLRTYVEATLDFPDEEDVDHLAAPAIAERFTDTRRRLQALLGQSSQARLLTEGIEIALLGCPNVGKSSLLNRLSGADRAIVSNLPGTTRDLLEVDLVLGGIPVTLVDTAGLRASTDQIEREGVRRALVRAQRVNLCLLIVDAAAPALPPELAELGPDQTLLIVINKSDLLSIEAPRSAASLSSAQAQVMAELAPALEQFFSAGSDLEPVFCSAQTGVGIPELITRVLARVGYQQDAAPFSARQRHIEALTAADNALTQAGRWLEADAAERAVELFAEDLRSAHEALGTIVGRVTADDLLGEIFASFCIGK